MTCHFGIVDKDQDPKDPRLINRLVVNDLKAAFQSCTRLQIALIFNGLMLSAPLLFGFAFALYVIALIRKQRSPVSTSGPVQRKHIPMKYIAKQDPYRGTIRADHLSLWCFKDTFQWI
jgi:hypothetical protein